MSEVISQTVNGKITLVGGSLITRAVISPLGDESAKQAIDTIFYEFAGKNVRIEIKVIP